MFVIYTRLRNLPMKFIYFGMVITILSNLLVGLVKINYEDVNVREKLIFFITPFFTYFFVGILATIIMMTLTAIKVLN